MIACLRRQEVRVVDLANETARARGLKRQISGVGQGHLKSNSEALKKAALGNQAAFFISRSEVSGNDHRRRLII